MKLLEERISAEGKVLPGDILKVDGFINHRIDVPFMAELGREFYRLYKNDNITKILTIEASGIGIACLTAIPFGVPVVFAKKSKTSNTANDSYKAQAHSYTHGTENTVIVSKEWLSESDRILIIDDFLANGSALSALCEIAEQAGATVVGAGIIIEKSYQGGGDMLRAKGLRIESLAKIANLNSKNGIIFSK